MSVQLHGVDFIVDLVSNEFFSAKMVFNQFGAIFFDVHKEHRDMKAGQISYKDDYKGNALAAMLAPKRIEVRYHSAYIDERVAEILAVIREEDCLKFMLDWQVTYQGRELQNPA